MPGDQRQRFQSHSTVELTWALILSSLRHIGHEAEQLKRGVWQTTVGTGLRGKTLGVYALGNIGRKVAEFGKAFGMTVTCWGREPSRAKARAAGYVVPESREAYFSSADVLSLHILYRPDTRGIIKAADLACMKPTALLVNTSRAGLIEEGALVDGLKKGSAGFAAIDVYEEEPVVGGAHPLLALPNALCTPHLGYAADYQFEGKYTSGRKLKRNHSITPISLLRKTFGSMRRSSARYSQLVYQRIRTKNANI